MSRLSWVTNGIVKAAPTFTVQWSSVPTATTYILEAGSQPGLSDVGRVTAANTSLGPATVTYGTTYFLRVPAVNAAGVGPPSAEHVLVAR